MTEEERRYLTAMDNAWRETFHNICIAFRMQREQLKALTEEVRKLSEEVTALRQDRQGSLFNRSNSL
jgi:DNA-binding protein H-NS